MPHSSVRRCVICGRRSSYLVQVDDGNPADSPDEPLDLHQSPMCLLHAREALPDASLPRVTLARQLAIHPALGRKKKHFEEYLVYAVLTLLGDVIVWANQVQEPSIWRLAAGLSLALLGALILFRAYVVRMREKLERQGESAGSNRVDDQGR